VQNPAAGIDPFTLTITIDPTYVPETIKEIDNINLGSKLAVYTDSGFSVPPSPSGFRQSEIVYISQAINLAAEDKNLWELDLQKVTICLVLDGSFGCKNAVERYILISDGELQTDVGGFAPTFYAPGTVTNNRFTSVAGISFKALPLANKKPASRVFFVEFESLASLSNGQKRVIQQNAKVEETTMLNVQDDEVIDTQEEENGKTFADLFTPTTVIFSVGALAGCIVLVTLIVSLFVYHYKIRKNEHTLVDLTDAEL